MVKNISFSLFTPPITTSNNQQNLDKPIVLDPTELYDIPPGYIQITTDVEWFKFFGVTDSPCWVKGKRLCEWAEAWLRVRNRTAQIAEIKIHPRTKLAALFQPLPLPLPSDWTDEQLLILSTKLDSYPQDNPIAYLLADITNSDQQIWLAEPSIENLATWLAISVPKECEPLERVWQQKFPEHDLAIYYKTENKLSLLSRWLHIAEPVIEELGKYPLPIPNFITGEFDRYWEQELLRTQGKILDNLILNEQPGIERIKTLAYNVFNNRPNWLNQVRETTLNTYLSYQQKVELSQRQPQPQPQPLALDATPKEALTWTIKNYLPFRRWETVIEQTLSDQRISDRLADSFVEWTRRNYPAMILDSVANSCLNYNVASLVQNLCQESPVLWVVVDGLGWLDHQELISLLIEDYKLAPEAEIEPRFSILPTKTEYAKWSLYAQLLPSDSSWVADASKAFPKMKMGKRYTDGQLDKLYAALKKNTHKLYCWDTDAFDSLYHSQRDWQSLYQIERPHALEGIAKKINYCLQQYPDSENLRVVIASDHGQIMGTSEKITHCPPELERKGRMAIGKTDDPRFVVLERDCYGIPHDISIVRGSATLSAFSYKQDKQVIGCHGGLFPEEVVVGVSVLRKSQQRLPVIISCSGKGEARQSGELEITIDNPNSLPLTELRLYIKELPVFCTGQPIDRKIAAHDRISFKIVIPDVPELPPTYEGNHLSLSGKLTFRFTSAETGSANLTPDSKIIVTQIFRSGGINIDEFL
jgi:hypothetical protein